MALTQGDLAAIAQLLDTRLDAKLDAFEGKMNKRFDALEARMDSLEARMDSLEAKMDALEARMDALEARMDALEGRVDSLESRMDSVESDIRTLKGDVQRISLMLENVVLPRLNTIEACYLDTYRRYQRDADRMEKALDNIEVLNAVTANHSERLQKLA